MLRLCVRPDHSLTPRDRAGQDQVYARQLCQFDLPVVAEVCERRGASTDPSKWFFPPLGELIGLCQDLTDHRAAKARLAALPLPAPKPMPRVPTSAEILAGWQVSDAEVRMIVEGGGFYGELMARISANWRPEREREHPELAARYYAAPCPDHPAAPSAAQSLAS